MRPLLLLLPLLLTANPTQEMEAMERLYLQNGCNSCHGIYGEGIGASPRLRGVKEATLLRRMEDLQQGKTRSPFGGVMISFAKALDSNQTRLMAKYLSTMKENLNQERYEIPYEPAGDGGS
jgi:cytochrome c553